MSQAKNGNSSTNTLKSHKAQYGRLSSDPPHIQDTENSDIFEDIYNKEIPTDLRHSLLFKVLKNYTFKQDLDVEILTSSGININQTDSDGKTILMYAAEKGNIQLVQSVLYNGADPQCFDKNDKSALFYAIDTNTENIDVVSILLEHPGCIRKETQDRMTPLLKAVERRRCETAKLLLEKGALINTTLESTGDTPLHIAVRNNDKDIIKLLFEKHCDPSKKNKKKQTALDLCEPGTELHELLQNLASKSKETVSQIVTNSINTPNLSQNKSTAQNENDEKASTEFNEVIVSHLDQPQKVQKTEKGEKIENKKNKQKGGNQTLQETVINQENRSDQKESEDSVYQLNDFPDSSDDQNSLNHNREIQRKRNTSGASGASFSSITSGNSDKQLREYIGPLDTNPPTETPTISTSPSNTSKFSRDPNKQAPQNQNLNPQQVQQAGPNQQNSNQKGKKQRNMNSSQPNNGPTQNQGNFGGQKQQNTQQPQQQIQQQQPQQFQQPTQNYQPQFNNMMPQQQLPQQQIQYNQNVNFNGKSPQQDANGNPKFQKNQNRQFETQRNQPNQGSGNKMNDQKQLGLDTNFTPSKDKSQTILSPQLQNGIQFGNQPINTVSPLTYFQMSNMGGFNNPNLYNANKNQMQNGLVNGEPNPRGMKMNLNLSHPSTQKHLEDQANLQTLKSKNEELNQKNTQLNRERNDLKMQFDDLSQSEKKLQETIKEKEMQLKALSAKYENLEKTLKAREADGGVIVKEEKSIMTEYIPEDFNPIEKLLEDPRPNQDNLFLQDMHNQLHEEILKFESSVNKYNLENKDNYDNLIKKIAESVNEIVPDSTCEIYGSFATGLSLPWSDIDIVVKLPNPGYTSGILDNLESNLKKKKWVVETKYIRNTTVPVLKITCIPKENSTATKKIDISIQDPRHNGLPCVELVKEYLQAYPSLRSLVLVLKHLLFTLNLNDTYSGGLSSYGLILMIVWYFQTRQSVNCMSPVESCNLATFLTGFLYCYGFEYDYYNLYQVFPKKLVKGKERDLMPDYYYNQFQNPPSYSDPKIYIQDPLSPNNNVGRSTFHIKEIKLSFMAAFFEAFKPCNCAVHNYASENLGDKKSRCSSIFRRMLNAYHPNK